jgi:hypothetical protein
MCIFVSGFFALLIPFLASYVGKESLLGDSFITRFIVMLFLSAPFFVWGEMLVRFTGEQKTYSMTKRIISVIAFLLTPVVIIFVIGIVTMDLQ